MARVVYTLLVMGWTMEHCALGWRGARSCVGGSIDRTDISKSSPAYIMWLGSPSWVYKVVRIVVCSARKGDLVLTPSSLLTSGTWLRNEKG